MKVYSLKIVYNEEKEEIEYISEEVREDDGMMEDAIDLTERGVVILNDYFDEEGLELISGCYIIGEA